MSQNEISKNLLAQIDGRSFTLQIRRVNGKADPRFEYLISASNKIIPEDIEEFLSNWADLNWIEFAGDSEIPAGYKSRQNEYYAYLYSANFTSYLLEDFRNYMNKITNNY